MEDIEKQDEKTKRENYERIIFALAILFSEKLDVDIVHQTEYSMLTPA